MTEWKSCSRELACQAIDHGLVEYMIDYDSDLTINNIVTRSNLVCSKDGSLALIGTYYFLGVFFSFLMWIKCTDLWGRKPIVLLGSGLQLLAFGGLLLLPLNLTII
jgi:MFS family permease